MSEKRTSKILRHEARSQENVCVVQFDVRASFATAFSAWRRKNRVPLKTIAKELGVSISTVDSWELGLSFPGAYNFERLVEYTGLPPCKLFCVMADKCVPADCLLALRQLSEKPH